MNSLPDLSCSLCHPPPSSPCEIPLGEKLLVGLEGIQVERQSPLLTALVLSLSETWPDQSERPAPFLPCLPAPSAPILPLDPPLTLHTPPPPTTPSELTVQAPPPGVVICLSFCSRCQGNPKTSCFPQRSWAHSQPCCCTPLQTPHLACAPPLFLKTQAAPNNTPFPRPLNLYVHPPGSLHMGFAPAEQLLGLSLLNFNNTSHPARNTLTLS